MLIYKLNTVFISDSESDNNTYALLDIVDLYPNSERLYTKNVVMNVEALKSIDTTEIHSNVDEILKQIYNIIETGEIRKFPAPTVEKVLNFKDEIYLVDILSKLSDLGSKYRYNPLFYKELTGGFSFENFEPRFETASLTADKLIISNKKLNVVLISTIEGLVDINSYSQPMMRFVPFKLIRQGEIMFDELDVYYDEENRKYLDSLPHVEDKGEYATIKLKEFQPFYSSEFTMKELYQLLVSINSLKVTMKALNYMANGLKKNISREDLDENEWYRGEAVDDSYVSDEGTSSMEIWIKGQKQIPSIDKLFTASDGVAVSRNVRIIADSTLELSDLELTEDYELTLKAFAMQIINDFNNGEFNHYVFHMLNTIVQCLAYEGTPLHRYKHIKVKRKNISKMLNNYELKLLSIRKKLFDTTDGKDVTDNLYLLSKGHMDGGTHDSIGIYSNEVKDTIMFRSYIIESKPSLTDEAQISTDPRSEN